MLHLYPLRYEILCTVCERPSIGYCNTIGDAMAGITEHVSDVHRGNALAFKRVSFVDHAAAWVAAMEQSR